MITAFMIVRDEAARLPACVASLQGAVERVIVADTGSTDGTQDWLARMAAAPEVALTWFPLAFSDFSQARTAVLARVTTPWALWIDADERLSPELAARLRRLVDSGEIADHDVWSLPRRNLAWGRPLRARGLQDQRLVRLLRVGRATLSGDPVHEGLRPLPGATRGDLAEPLLHDALTSLRAYLAKIDLYTRLEARSGRSRYGPWQPLHLVVTGAATFWRAYVWHGSWRDGWRGLVWSGLAAWSATLRSWRVLAGYLARMIRVGL